MIIVRDKDGGVRGFHNICRHRGNKLVWNDFPNEETSGTCRQFTCKYHGWRYDLDGSLTFVQQESEFFDLDKADYGLVARPDRGVGGVHLREPRPGQHHVGARSTSVSFGAGLEGYPFGEMTQVYKYRANVGSNWKLFIDAFAEFYHAPVLHAKQATDEESRKLQGFGFEASPTRSTGRTAWCRRGGAWPHRRTRSMVKPIENGAAQRAVRAVGPARHRRARPRCPRGSTRPAHPAWGIDSFVFFPNFMLLVWAPGWYLTYHYWPTSYNSHIFEGTLYFVPPKNATDRLRQELAAVTFKEYALQDGNTLEATQTMIESRAVTEFPLNDQEILLRHLHKTARGYVADYEKSGTPVDVPAAS